jgi:hypothetical protein
MTEIVELVKLSPASLLLAVLIFGVAPGLCLRLIVKLYPREHPRRKELVAELYKQKRLERLLFVGEQLEVALFEGVSERKLDSRRRRRVVGSRMYRFHRSVIIYKTPRGGHIVVDKLLGIAWRYEAVVGASTAAEILDTNTKFSGFREIKWGLLHKRAAPFIGRSYRHVNYGAPYRPETYRGPLRTSTAG